MIVGYAEWENTQKDILDRVNTGETISSLAREYGTTPNIMSLHVDKLRKRKKLLEENELYSSMYYSEIEVDAKMAKRIVHSLNRVNVTTISDLQKLTIEELLDIRNFGLGQIEVMEKLGWIQRDEIEPKCSGHATTSLLSEKPCSWKQRCEELEQVIFKRYILQNEVNHIDEFLFHKLEPAIALREIKEEKEDD